MKNVLEIVKYTNYINHLWFIAFRLQSSRLFTDFVTDCSNPHEFEVKMTKTD